MGFSNFVPYPMKVTVIRVESYERKSLSGMLSSLFYSEEMRFNSTMELLLLLEEIQDELGFPESTMDIRSFPNEGPGKTGLRDTRTSGNPSIGTFKVLVFFRQNASWQGNIYWIERDEVASFRSVFELLRLFDSALGHTEEGSIISSPPEPELP